MTPYLLVLEDFLSNIAAVRSMLDKAEFGDQQNLADGFCYPMTAVIAAEDEVAAGYEALTEEVRQKFEVVLGVMVKMRLLVCRASPEGVHAPEQAHCDLDIIEPSPQYTAIIYLNRPEHCKGGTSLLVHTPTGVQIGSVPGWKEDQNDESKWRRTMFTPMQENRAAIFPSCLIHRSEPVGGFGKIEDGNARVVLVALFDLVA